MKSLLYYFSICVFILISFSATAQSGQYDVRFKTKEIQCGKSKVLVDIEVKATSEGKTFKISDQNFRFSYTRDAVAVGSATIKEQHLTGFFAPFSFYDPHTLTGTLDTIISYNVVLAGGEGKWITTEWLTVGTLSFDIIDATKCLELRWHDQAPENFPPTFIGEKIGGNLYAAQEGNYYNASICLNPCQVPTLPVEMLAFTAEENDCGIDLEWATATEIANDYFQVQKSTDGIEFSTIATIEGAGNSTTTNHYSYRDVRQTALSYYRLVQVDFGGEKTISEIVAVKSECFEHEADDSIVSLYPNPVSGGDVNVQFQSTINRPNGKLVITDALGRVVQTLAVELLSGQNIYSFSADDLPNGMYSLKIFAGDFVSPIQQFVKVE